LLAAVADAVVVAAAVDVYNWLSYLAAVYTDCYI
jgi:hypothetical protein